MVLVGGIVVAVALLFPSRRKLALGAVGAALIVGARGTDRVLALHRAHRPRRRAPDRRPGERRTRLRAGRCRRSRRTTGRCRRLPARAPRPGTFGPPGVGGAAGGFPGGTGGFPGGTAGGTADRVAHRPAAPAVAGGGIGGLLNGTTRLVARSRSCCSTGRDGYRWTAAAIGANNAASYQLASGEAIMAIGGFNGSDPAPTLAQFQAYVRQHADPLLHRWWWRRGRWPRRQLGHVERDLHVGRRATSRRRRSAA